VARGAASILRTIAGAEVGQAPRGFDALAAADVFLEATRGRPELRDELLESWGRERGLSADELNELRGAVVVRALFAVARARRG
jgi:hypothetical protein